VFFHFPPTHTTTMAEEDNVPQGSFNCITMDLEDCPELEQPAPIQASLCRKGVFVIMCDNPCKVNELKISKTGKHGSSKANMVGYDVINNRKYQETVPGHATMWGFEPKKMEYEVVDISNGQITAMTADGKEKFFNLPEEEHGVKLAADFAANVEKNGDAFYVITVMYCPRMVGKKWLANIYVESYKLGAKE